MSTQNAYEQIRFINDVIKDRAQKNQPTFFSIKLERLGVLTPLVTKEEGDNFYETILNYLTKYDVTALLVELFNGKSRSVKEPLQTYKIFIKKNTEIALGGTNNNHEAEIISAETSISPEKHFYTMAEKERTNIMQELKIKQLEWEIEVLRKKNKKKKARIEELETSIYKSEKDKKHSLGNVSLGSITSNAFENFMKSDFGLGILKNVFGAKEETLKGLLGEEEIFPRTENETKSTATLIVEKKHSEKAEEQQKLSPEQKIRLEVIKKINDFMLSSNDGVLRLYYELIQLCAKDIPLLQKLYSLVKSYKEQTQAEKQETQKPVSNSDDANGTHQQPKSGVNIDDTS